MRYSKCSRNCSGNNWRPPRHHIVYTKITTKPIGLRDSISATRSHLDQTTTKSRTSARQQQDHRLSESSMGKKQSKKLDPEILGDLLKNTNFDEKELKAWYKGFLKDCPSGYLTKQQFIEMYKKVFDKGDASRLATCVFRRFDVNGDGKIGQWKVHFILF